MPTPLIIDTDGGVDDAVALWWAATHPDIELVAVTVVWGNVPVEAATNAVLRVLEMADRPDVPVAVGEPGPIGPAPGTRPAAFIHGEDGLGGADEGRVAASRAVDEPAAELLRRLVGARSGEIALATIGPLSTIGRLVGEDPTFAADVASLVVMGGAARRFGNALPAGEANIVHDPEAAQAVVAGAWSEPPLLVGLDVTHQATMSDDEFALVAEHRNAAAAFLDAPLRFYRRFGSTFTAPDTPCHDLLAVMSVLDPALLNDAPVLPLAVDRGRGPAWGTTVVDFRAPYFASLAGARQEASDEFHPWRIGLGADVERFRAAVRVLFGG
jgi:purine nucleosidase